MKLRSPVFHWLMRALLSIFLRAFLNIRWRVDGPLPPGPKVLAVNHPTVWDAFPILAFVRSSYVHTLIEEQIWSFRLPRLLFTLANQIVLYRTGRSEQSVRDALFILSCGRSVLIAPEGERTAPGKRVRAHRGVVRLALEGRAVIVPVGAWIEEKDIRPRDVTYIHDGQRYTVTSYFPRFRANYGVVVGTPVSLQHLYGKKLPPEEYQKLATDVLDRIYALAQEARELFRKR